MGKTFDVSTGYTNLNYSNWTSVFEFHFSCAYNAFRTFLEHTELPEREDPEGNLLRQLQTTHWPAQCGWAVHEEGKCKESGISSVALLLGLRWNCYTPKRLLAHATTLPVCAHRSWRWRSSSRTACRSQRSTRPSTWWPRGRASAASSAWITRLLFSICLVWVGFNKGGSVLRGCGATLMCMG